MFHQLGLLDISVWTWWQMNLVNQEVHDSAPGRKHHWGGGGERLSWSELGH